MSPLTGSEGDVLCFCASSVFCFYFLLTRNCLATAGRIFTNFSPDVFAVIFVNGGTPWKSVPQIFGGLKRPFLERKFALRRLWTTAARKRGGILRKLKELV